MAKSKYKTIKHGKRFTSGFVILIVAVVVILALGCLGSVFIVGNAIDAVEYSSGVVLNMNLYGDDIVIDIIGGDRVDELKYIFIEISGYNLQNSEIGRPVEKGQKQIIYEGIAGKIASNRLVAVRGLFSDGKTVQIVSKELRFS